MPLGLAFRCPESLQKWSSVQRFSTISDSYLLYIIRHWIVIHKKERKTSIIHKQIVYLFIIYLFISIVIETVEDIKFSEAVFQLGPV